MNEEYQLGLKYTKEFMPSILSFVQRGLKDFTDHGTGHSERIEEMLSEIIKLCNDSGIDKCKINDTERYLLLLSAWFHDIGCIIDRKDHATRSAEIIGKHFSDIMYFEKYIPLLKVIIASHSDEGHDVNKLENIPKEVYSINNESVNLKYISALFRLVDACDIQMIRCPRIVYKILKPQMEDKSKEYWEAHQNIVGTPCFNLKDGVIEIQVANKEKTKIIIEDLNKNFKSSYRILREYSFSF